MNTNARKNQIEASLSAFSNLTYSKPEYLPEFRLLLQQTCELIYSSEFSEENIPSLWDIKSELRRRNEECGNVADKELELFEDNLDEVYNLYKAEISGNNGEQKVFNELDYLNCQNYVLHNVELEFDGKRCEIDAVVITNYGIFPIEIKNSNKNIHIDKIGYIIRNGTIHSKCDGNLVRKMDLREAFLRKALERAGMENVKVFKIVAITNTHIEFTNEAHRCLKVLYSNQLAYFIENFKYKSWHSYEDICTMVAAINEVRCSEPYQMKVDMTGFKDSLANLMVKLEEAESAVEEDMPVPKSAETNNTVQDTQKNVRRKRIVRSICKRTMQAAAFAGIMLVNAAFLNDGKFFKR